MTSGENAPLFSRVMLWVNERFPLSNAPLFILVYILTMAVVSTVYKDVTIAHIIIGSLLSFSFFLLLRVLDEHKDYKDDCVQHPERVLQRGIIRLVHLKFIGLICILIQLGGMVLLAPGLKPMLMSWGLMLLWTLLMTKEFFVAEWLKQHFFLYAFSHTLIMPFVIWWLATLTFPEITLNTSMVLLMALSFFSGLSFEITRKCKGPDEDRPDVTTYSQLYGRPLSIVLIILLLAAMILAQYSLILTARGEIPFWFYIVSALINVLTVGQLFRFLLKANKSNRKKNEAMVGLAMLTGYSLCIAAMYF
ncbi:UbiA family prenyltransferase [Kosakonia sp. H02]|nr:UbiA family prenyltransferase [Kosakonia sp. H02]